MIFHSGKFVFENGKPEGPGGGEKAHEAVGRQPEGAKTENEGAKRDSEIANLEKSGGVNLEHLRDAISTESNTSENVKKVTEFVKRLLAGLDKTIKNVEANLVSEDIKKVMIGKTRGMMGGVLDGLVLDPAKTSGNEIKSAVSKVSRFVKFARFDPGTGVLDITGFAASQNINGKDYIGIYRKGEADTFGVVEKPKAGLPVNTDIFKVQFSSPKPRAGVSVGGVEVGVNYSRIGEGVYADASVGNYSLSVAFNAKAGVSAGVWRQMPAGSPVSAIGVNAFAIESRQPVIYASAVLRQGSVITLFGGEGAALPPNISMPGSDIPNAPPAGGRRGMEVGLSFEHSL